MVSQITIRIFFEREIRSLVSFHAISVPIGLCLELFANWTNHELLNNNNFQKVNFYIIFDLIINF